MTKSNVPDTSGSNKAKPYQNALNISLTVRLYTGQALSEDAQGGVSTIKLINRQEQNDPLSARLFALYDAPALLVEVYYHEPVNFGYGRAENFISWLNERIKKVYGSL